MSSRRPTRDRSPKSRLRMDSYKNRGSPWRREIDTVMKKARRSGSQSTYWNKKLLEAEEKDPNRWRHSGYKEMYHGEKKSSNSGSGSGSSKSRSRSPARSKSKSPVRKISPRRRMKSPLARARMRRGSRGRSPRRISRNRSNDFRNGSGSSDRSRSPKRRSSVTLRTMRRSDSSSVESVRRKSPPPARPPSPPRKRRSESGSSDSSSSCSNDSCSVCSPKRNSSRDRDVRKEPKRRTLVRKKEPPVRPRPRVPVGRSRSRSFSPPRQRPELLKGKAKKRIEKSAIKPTRPPFIKVESESESSSCNESGVGISGGASAPKISLSERFGRMAQWSVDRDIEHRNLRITAGDRLTVEMDSPPSPLYPPSLSSIAEMGSSWDDVRVRYSYYKEHGYLRDLTLQDYIKWEQWWYKYQDWLDTDRHYDRYYYSRRRP